MKKNIVVSIIAVAGGVLLGYLFFGTHSSEADKPTTQTHEHATDAQVWTCSMHPQIRQKEPGDCPICGMDLIPVEGDTQNQTPNQFTMTEHAMALANIKTTVLGRNSAQTTEGLALSGTIKENEEATAIQPAHYNGRIERLYVKTIGETVHKGQAVATVYAPELVSAQQELLTAYKLKASQPKLYQAVRNKMRNWKLSESQINAIEQEGTIQNSITIYSNVNGVVTDLLIEEGAHIMDGKPIFKVSNLNTVWASFDVYESQLATLTKGQPITITTQAYPGKTFDATVSFIDPVLNTQTRTVTIRATLPNPDGLFKPGMFVKGILEGTASDSPTSLTVPASAVLWTGERSLVYVKTATTPPTFEMREVTLGTQVGDQYTILEGLSNGEELVTNGTFTVDAAAQLQGKKSMMNQGKTETEVKVEMGQRMTFDLSASIQKELKILLPDYLRMKDALVAGDVEKASRFASELISKFNKIDASSATAMVQKRLTKSNQLLAAILESDQLKHQRNHFIGLNEILIPLFKNTHDFKNTLFVQRCPMANSNKGASWLSNQKEIRNPYYGNAMLTCGSIVDSLH